MKSIIYKREAGKLQKEILKYIHPYAIFSLLPMILSFLSIPIVDYFGFQDAIPPVGLLGFILAIPFIAICGYIQGISHMIQYTLVKSKTDLGSLDERESIDEILEKTAIIGKTISTLMRAYRVTRYLLTEPGRVFLRSKIDTEISYFLRFLLDLKSELSIHLSEQKNTLEQMKYEVEKNIAGTTELNKVSELQKARLDLQIEQFEELQRVLVKV